MQMTENNIEQKLDLIINKFSKVETDINGISIRLENLDKNVAALNSEQKQIRTDLTDVKIQQAKSVEALGWIKILLPVAAGLILFLEGIVYRTVS